MDPTEDAEPRWPAWRATLLLLLLTGGYALFRDRPAHHRFCCRRSATCARDFGRCTRPVAGFRLFPSSTLRQRCAGARDRPQAEDLSQSALRSVVWSMATMGVRPVTKLRRARAGKNGCRCGRSGAQSRRLFDDSGHVRGKARPGGDGGLFGWSHPGRRRLPACWLLPSMRPPTCKVWSRSVAGRDRCMACRISPCRRARDFLRCSLPVPA